MFYSTVHKVTRLSSDPLTPLQAAVIRQDSILELFTKTGPVPNPTPGPRLSRSMSRDTGLDASGEAVLLRRQVELLQEEVTRLRLKGEDPAREGAKLGTNGEISDVIKGEKVSSGVSQK